MIINVELEDQFNKKIKSNFLQFTTAKIGVYFSKYHPHIEQN